MGQIKNIKLHIVTDIKCKYSTSHTKHTRCHNQYDYTAKEFSWATNGDFETNTNTLLYSASKGFEPKPTQNSTWVNVLPTCTGCPKLPLRRGRRSRARSV